VLRAHLNLRLSEDTLEGSVIDIGGGRDADYISFMERTEDMEYKTLDLKAGQTVNFETDNLPAEDGTYKTVLFLNVMEHIYNHKHIIREVYRVAREDGKVLGFVPFLMWYHPDHHDYYRYTHECLAKIFDEIGVETYKIDTIARGPFTAASHVVVLSFPKILRVPVFTTFFLLDRLFLLLRPTHGERYAMGYYFTLNK